ncbi:MAG: hypothetical protein LKF74_03985 [Megasphaera sp.]|jgi:vacuolar-type H+-ATPase subunit I/STV1|nr:hypothetical protein [Megasphaera sp.]MCH4187977.1 hypothetical protein [Megasphaera sp.]MCH4217697.1 hypothetical protein [Megasphaera sp.]
MAKHNGLIIIACLVASAAIGGAAFMGNNYNHTKHYKENAAVVLQSHEKIEAELKAFSDKQQGKNLEIPDFDASDALLTQLQQEHKTVREEATALRAKNDDTKAIQQDLNHTLTAFDAMLASYDDVVKSQKAELLATDKATAHAEVTTAMEKAHDVSNEYNTAKQTLQKELE